MVQVESSNVKAVDWDPASRLLTVEFKDGTIYEWDDIDGARAADIVFSSSVGGAIHRLGVKGRRIEAE